MLETLSVGVADVPGQDRVEHLDPGETRSWICSLILNKVPQSRIELISLRVIGLGSNATVRLRARCMAAGSILASNWLRRGIRRGRSMPTTTPSLSGRASTRLPSILARCWNPPASQTPRSRPGGRRCSRRRREPRSSVTASAWPGPIASGSRTQRRCCTSAAVPMLGKSCRRCSET